MKKEAFQERKKLEDIVERLDKDVDSIIVEGWKDRKVMKKLGFSGKIFLSAERKLEDLAEDVSRSSNRVAVLTDFDNHGKKVNREISNYLEKKVDVIRSSRKEFGSQLTSTGRRAIEDIKPLFKSKQEKFVEAELDRLFF